MSAPPPDPFECERDGDAPTPAQRMARGLLPVLVVAVLVGAVTYASLWALASHRGPHPTPSSVTRQTGSDQLRGTIGNQPDGDSREAAGKHRSAIQVPGARGDGASALPAPVPAALVAMAVAMMIGLGIHLLRAKLTVPVPARRRRDEAGPQEEQSTADSVRRLRNAAQSSAAAGGQPTAEPPAISAMIRRLENRSDTGSGVRTLVTSEHNGVDVLDEAIRVGEAMSLRGNRVILVLWSLTGLALPFSPIPERKHGITDLLAGRATFEHIISRIPGSTVHLIQPGTPPVDAYAILNPDLLNLTLDALDEAYDQIVVAGARNDTALLFEAIEGRFEAAVLVGENSGPGKPGRRTLLGFDVTGIDIVVWEHGEHAAAGLRDYRAGAMSRRA